MAEQTNEQVPRLQEYQKRFDQLMDSAREGVERQTPEVLEKLAATATSIAHRLEDMARDARERAAEKGAAPESAGTPERAPEPPDAAPASSDEPGTAGA